MTQIPTAYRIRAVAGVFFRRSITRGRNQFLDLARASCRATQHALLQDLLRLNQTSAFSRDFGLTERTTLDEFRKQVPVSDYELIRSYVDKVARGDHAALLGESNRLQMFAMTSGTTAASKLIPVTTRFLNDYRRGWQTWGIGTYSDHALLQQLNIVQISSSHQKTRTADGTPCGNISGLVAAMQKRVVRSMYTIPAAVSEITDADAKRYTILRLALADPWVGMLITANPSTLLQLAEFANSEAEHLIRDIHNGGISDVDLPASIFSEFRRRLRPDIRRAGQLQQIMERHGELRPRECWPGLQALGVWCGGSAAAYIPKLKQVFDGITIRDHGLHASEGRMTLPLEDESRAGLLEIQTHFFEFMPVTEAESERPEVLEAHELREGAEYFILLTTSSGLYRYNIRDVVRCTGFYGTTPFLEFRHKGAHISSITGEKLAESQVVEAVNATAQAIGLRFNQFTLTPQWGQPPSYMLYLWWDKAYLADSGIDLNRLATMVDQHLSSANEEYRDKRQSGRLGSIRAQILSADHWHSFTRARQSRSGGSPEQYKHPCLLPDPEFRGLIGERGASSGERVAESE
jgi:hypothetical protein